MKFGIVRASALAGERPCEEAIEESFPNKWGRPYNIYTLEINTLEELIKFGNRYGRIIIGAREEEDPETHLKGWITIYDDWIE